MKTRPPLQSTNIYTALTNSSTDQTWIGVIQDQKNPLYQLVSSDQLKSDDSQPNSPIDFEPFSRYRYFQDVKTVAFSIKYSDENKKWIASFIFPEESGMEVPSYPEELAEKIISFSITPELLTFNPESIAWAKISKTQFSRYQLLEFDEQEPKFFNDTIYLEITDDPKTLMCHTADSLSSIETSTLEIPWEQLPPHFPDTVEEIIKRPDALSVILTALNKRPEQELKAIFDRAESKAGDEFTIERRNQLLEKFDKNLLIHRGWFRCGIVNTGSYRKVLKEIREKALEKLQSDIDQINGKYYSIYQINEKNNMIREILLKALQMAIFKDHRNNFIFTGAWGRTAAISKIEKLLKQYPQPKAIPHNGYILV